MPSLIVILDIKEKRFNFYGNTIFHTIPLFFQKREYAHIES